MKMVSGLLYFKIGDAGEDDIDSHMSDYDFDMLRPRREKLHNMAQVVIGEVGPQALHSSAKGDVSSSNRLNASAHIEALNPPEVAFHYDDIVLQVNAANVVDMTMELEVFMAS